MLPGPLPAAACHPTLPWQCVHPAVSPRAGGSGRAQGPVRGARGGARRGQTPGGGGCARGTPGFWEPACCFPRAHSSGLGLWVSCLGAVTHSALGPVLGLLSGFEAIRASEYGICMENSCVIYVNAAWRSTKRTPAARSNTPRKHSMPPIRRRFPILRRFMRKPATG